MSRMAKGHFRRKREAPLILRGKHVTIQGPSPDLTSSVSGLLRDSAHVRQARSRCLRCCPGMTVTTLGRPPHRAHEGHGQHLQIRSLGTDDRHADYLGLGAALRAVEPPGDNLPRERPNGFQERPRFTVRHCSYLDFQHLRVLHHSRSSRAYPARQRMRVVPAASDAFPRRLMPRTTAIRGHGGRAAM
jgi:hypothetical protein